MNWNVNPDRAVLLVHDMQRYFLDPFPAGRSPLVELLANAAQLRTRFAELGIPVVYTAQPGGMSRTERGLLHDVWGPGMNREQREREIVPEVAPAAGDTVLTKWRYSAFHRTGLVDLLAQWGRDQLVICGVYAHIGCLVSACDAFCFDIETFLVADAVGDFSRYEHDLALDYAAGCCAAVLSTEEVFSAVARSAAVAGARYVR
ncbi:MAG: isochorismatase family protein [Pseudonocardia sp.]|nr:isochorismatase family protein [Pseudonocardia sp.]